MQVIEQKTKEISRKLLKNQNYLGEFLTKSPNIGRAKFFEENLGN
jgi:hypothetical protein